VKLSVWGPLVLGCVIAAFAFLLLYESGAPLAACHTAAITGLCATWWVAEPIPIPVTSLIPFAALPLLGVLDHEEVATAYGHSLILLLLGGFMLSTAMERSGAHRRLAVAMVRLTGGHSPRRIVLGFMLACALLSMWISNTATTLMMLPVALALTENQDDDSLATPLLLGVAYGSSIGGLGTPIGTPPNVIFMGVYQEATGSSITFLDWMKIGVPVVLALIPLTWLVLTRDLQIRTALPLPKTSAWRPSERRVLVVFALTGLAWVTRTEPFGGWSGWFGISGAGDATVALLAVVLMFLLPNGEGSRLLDWQTAQRIPWGLLILFGGGIAIARAFEVSGLSAVLGSALAHLTLWPFALTLIGLCLGVCFLTEVTSNTATAALLMPVMAAAAKAVDMDPKLIMIPVALCTSCAFMLPVATVPNAIVYGSNKVSAKTMARTGLVLNLLVAPAIAILCMALL
jgi:solute carrier family 13 (sodium-dependent dicarboxylate transporter), member 2/3/5